ncbi:aspartyl protease family protein [Kordia zhangzhouensis]|uniref:aspartyl protease family protein n=1 Tax=Kordia zhangzhouensis TaxID=1620405 RepID=UPI000629115D|nr:aspartyl protease family protein [Kordia zhangzhouensis]
MKNRIIYSLLIVSFIINFPFALLAQQAQIPFVHDGLMYVKVKVNEYPEELNFVFDTGASTTVIDTKIAEKIGVKSNYQQPTEGAAGTEMYDIALFQKVQVENITLSETHIVLIDLERLSKKGNLPIDGIIGADIMKRFITQLDFDKKVIELYNDINEVAGVEKYTETPIVMDYSSIPQVQLEFTLNTKEKFSGNFLFDSGANFTFLLNTPFVNKQKIASKIGTTIENRAESLTTSSSFKIGKVANVRFGNYQFGEMPMNLSNSEAGVMASEEYTGILGIKIISRFNTILDYKNQKIYMQPNTTFGELFEFPTSGIALEKNAETINISNVVETSEAYQKGVRVGDELLQINQVEARNIKECRKLLKQEDKAVELTIKDQQGNIKRITIILKRLI